MMVHLTWFHFSESSPFTSAEQQFTDSNKVISSSNKPSQDSNSCLSFTQLLIGSHHFLQSQLSFWSPRSSPLPLSRSWSSSMSSLKWSVFIFSIITPDHHSLISDLISHCTSCPRTLPNHHLSFTSSQSLALQSSTVSIPTLSLRTVGASMETSLPLFSWTKKSPWLSDLKAILSSWMENYRKSMPRRHTHILVSWFSLIAFNSNILTGFINPKATPVFGTDVVYDVPNALLMQQKKFIKYGLSIENFRRYVGVIVDETMSYLESHVFECEWHPKCHR